jgi:hypothetical protein
LIPKKAPTGKKASCWHPNQSNEQNKTNQQNAPSGAKKPGWNPIPAGVKPFNYQYLMVQP